VLDKPLGKSTVEIIHQIPDLISCSAVTEALRGSRLEFVHGGSDPFEVLGSPFVAGVLLYHTASIVNSRVCKGQVVACLDA